MPFAKTKIPRLIVIGSLALLAFIVINPEHRRLYNYLFIAGLLTFGGGLLFSFKNKKAQLAILLFFSLIALPFFFPSKSINSKAISQSYLSKLTSYKDSTYFWGGEAKLGIDCSGLPRKAYRLALLQYGITHFNGRATRLYLEHWWFDTSAQALSESYRDFTKPLPVTGKISQLDNPNLQAGDIAITANKMHALVYLGYNNWIQAEPGAGKVIIRKTTRTLGLLSPSLPTAGVNFKVKEALSSARPLPSHSRRLVPRGLSVRLGPSPVKTPGWLRV